MATSLYRSSSNNTNSNNNLTANLHSWQDVAIPRRPQPRNEDAFRPSSSSGNNSSSVSDSSRKRPRIDGDWDGAGERSSSKGDSQPYSAPSLKKLKKSKGERRDSNSKLDAVRRSSIGSVKSTTSTASSSSSGGFRRLKKFSPDKKKKKDKTSSASSNTVSSSSKKTTPKDEISVSESFQQNQLRLWQAAQERANKIREMEEKKRLQAIKKKKLREKLQQERRQKLNGTPLNSIDELDDVDDNVGMEESLKVSRSTSVAEEASAAKKKKRKKLKKLQRQQSAAADTGASVNDSSEVDGRSSQPSSSWEEEGDDNVKIKKKKKKRRLLKLGRDEDERVGAAADMPRRKKNNRPVPTTDDEKVTPSRIDSLASPATPERNVITTTASLTPLSMGLADTVKTRVRSCNKTKDELELLQAASFEKKKRKKNKQAKKALIEVEDDDDDVPYSEPTTLKKKKKKKKQLQQSEDLDSSYEYGDAVRDVPKKKKKKKSLKNDYVYDADVETVSTKQERKSIDAMSDIANSETSSSATIITGKIKKKNRLKKLGSGFQDSVSSLEYTEKQRHTDHPLPFKKRMAMAAAAAESNSWERNGASTTASKISISSSGTNAGAHEPCTEASSISEFTHPLGSAALPPPPPVLNNTVHNLKPSSVPKEILSRPPTPPPSVPSLDFDVDTHAKVIGPTISSSDDSDSSSDSDTDEEELYSWANKMFGTSARPGMKIEAKRVEPTPETTDLTPEMCEMERRRQRQEEARTLSVKEVNAILKEEQSHSCALTANHWVRRSVRQPSRSLLNAPLTRKLLDRLRGDDNDMVVLKLKKYLPDPDTPAMVMDAVLEALEENTNCESLYIQNFNSGMKDKQVLHLLRILQQPSCNIWCLNIGETYNVSDETWEIFGEGLKKTKITHMYASEHTITTELKDEIRETIRNNRKKHNMHNDPNNLDTIVKCTHCWWNPINAKVLRPYLRKRGFESLLHDKEAQGLRGSMSEAPAE